jgi:hypothetical protein
MLRLTDAFPIAAARAAAATVRGRTALAAIEAAAHAEETPPRPPHGWLATRRIDRSLWYTQEVVDAHGFPMHGRSGPHPPPGIAPETIPLHEPRYDRDRVARMLARAEGLLRMFRPGLTVVLEPGLRCQAAAALTSTDRLAAHHQVALAHTALLEDDRSPLMASFWHALGQVIPPPVGKATVAELRTMADGFAAQASDAAVDMVENAAACGLVQLFAGAVRLLPDPGASLLAIGLPSAPATFGDDAHARLETLMMFCRKAGDPGLLEAVARATLNLAGECIQAALDAPDWAGYHDSIFHACHAAWLSHTIFGHLERHRHAVPGLVSDPLFDRLRNSAEERLVRCFHALNHWDAVLAGGAIAAHRLDLRRRARAAGMAAARSWAQGLTEIFIFYPRCMQAALVAGLDEPADDVEDARAVQAACLIRLGLAEPPAHRPDPRA